MAAIFPFITIDSENNIECIYSKQYESRPFDAIPIPVGSDLTSKYDIRTRSDVKQEPSISGHDWVYFVVQQMTLTHPCGILWKVVRFENSRSDAIAYAALNGLVVFATKYNDYIGHSLRIIHGFVM